MKKAKNGRKMGLVTQHTGLVGAVYDHLHAAGESGFENLVADQLSHVTGVTFRLAKSGRQFGIDALSNHATTIAVQCKQYGRKTALNLVALQAELLESLNHTQSLDAWILAATQTLGANDAVPLEQFAEKFGVELVVIDSSGPWPSDLEILLAADLSILRSHFASSKKVKLRAVDGLANKVRITSSFESRLGRLRTRLSDAKVGYDHWRRRSHRLLRDGFADEHQSARLFHQNLNLAEAKPKTVRRTRIHAALDSWWETQQRAETNTPRPFLAITGEEGDGKTWALANWIEEKIGSDRSEFPAVVWLSSRDVAATDLLSCLERHLNQSDGAQLERVRKQLDRWLSAVGSPRPQCVLVIDGLNESPRTTLWRTLLSDYLSQTPNWALSLIVTARTGYWEEHIPLDRRVPPCVISVTPFSDAEYAEALQKSNLRAVDFPSDIDDLVRKPRYFELAVQFRDEINRTGGAITRARLVYEDMKARYRHKVGYPITNEMFQEHLVKLAKLHKENYGRYDSQHVAAIPGHSDHDTVVTELITGGIFQRDGISYVFNEDQLPHALGLLVGEELCNAASATDPEELLAKWMEPQAAIDLKAQVLEYALLYSAYRKPAASRDVQCAILSAWNGHQNRLSHHADNLDAYITLMPEAYVLFAEQLAASGQLNSDVERSLLVAFVNGLNSAMARALLEVAVDRWCSYVCPAGDRYQKDEKEEERSQRVAEAERLAGKALTGPDVRIGNFVLHVIESPNNLHLGRFALCVISHLDKRRFLPAIMKLTLAEAIMAPSRRIDMAAWVIFFADTSLTLLIGQNANELLETGSEGAGIAAGWLLKWEGAAQNYLKYLQLPAKYRPDPWARHAHLFKDECLNFFRRWTPEICRRCMDRDDIPVHILWQELKRHSLNPAFRANKKAISRLVKALKSFSPTTIWTLFGHTTEDHNLEHLSEVLGRFAPKELGGFLRRVFASAVHRQDMALRQLSWRIPAHELVLKKVERESLRTAWATIPQNTTNLPQDDQGWIEGNLLFGCLPLMSAEKQLGTLVRRPDDISADSLLLEDCFRPLTPSMLAKLELGTMQDPTQIYRTLWFLSRYPKKLPRAVLEDVARQIRGPTSLIRYLALKILVLNKTVHARELYLQSDWHWPVAFKDHGWEIYWGSMGWIQWGKKRPFEHMLSRVHPCYLGRLVVERGSKKTEIGQYLQLVRTGLASLKQFLAKGAHPIPPVDVEIPHEDDDLRVVQYRAHKSPDNDPMGLLTALADTDASKGTVTFEELAQRAFDEEQAVERAAVDVREEAKQLCQFWFGDRFSLAAIDLIVQHDKNLIADLISAVGDEHAKAVQVVFHSEALYQSLLKTLLRRGDVRAPRLYRNLNTTSFSIQTVYSDSKINVADQALFGTRSKTSEVVESWEEHLARAATDHDLLTLAVLANQGGSRAWLKAKSRALLRSAIARDRAIGITLLGFLEDFEAESVLRRSAKVTRHEFERTLIDSAIGWQKKHAWSMHWLDRYWNSRDPDAAHGALILFEGCATSRAWRELHRLIFRTKEAHPLRRRVLDHRRDDMKRAIEANEKDLRDRYLGRKKHSELMAPWSRALFE